MIIPKPKHLRPEYADHFKEEGVADAYVNYPPYSPEVFKVLVGLIRAEPRVVLDIGCGTGEVARPLAALVDQIDAVDQSAAMIKIGRRRDGGSRPNINWVCQTAEVFPYASQYGLIVAGTSLHWMDWYSVLPRMARSLSPHGYLAIVGGHEIVAPWIDGLASIIPKYSTNKDFAPYNLVDELEQRHLFSVEGTIRTALRRHRMNVERYVELLHARSGFSRQRMGARSIEFDTAVRELVHPFLRGRMLSFEMATTVTWGCPLAPTAGCCTC